MVYRITATEAARQFSDILNRVKYRGDEFIVERGGEAICRISPAGATSSFTLGDFVQLMESLEPVDPEFARDVQEIVRSQPVEVPRSRWD